MKIRDRLLFSTLIGLEWVARFLSLPALRRCGRAVGTLAWMVARRDRSLALSQITAAFPEWATARRQTTVRAMFQHLGETLFEILWLARAAPEQLLAETRIENIEPVQRVLSEHEGVIVFTGHCGNWEWLAASVAALGHPVSVMQRERDAEQLNRFVIDFRSRFGIRTIDRGSVSAGRELIQAIRRGSLLAFLIDQNIRAESAPVPFFGRNALTPIGAAKLAIRTEAMVVCAFIRRGVDGSQNIHFENLRRVARDEDPIALTAELTALIEQQIRRAPEQWVWMHKRWRDRPKWDVTVRG